MDCFEPRNLAKNFAYAIVVNVNTASIRKIHVARVFHAIRENPGVCQRDLMNLAKLDPATVSCVLQLLEAAGWIVPVKRRAHSPHRLHVSALGRDAVAFGGVALAMEGFLPLLPNGISHSSRIGERTSSVWANRNEPVPAAVNVQLIRQILFH